VICLWVTVCTVVYVCYIFVCSHVWNVLCVDELEMKLEAEKDSLTFTKMSSPHYMEVAKTLLDK